MTRRTDQAEAQEIEAMLERERQREPRYPIIERTEIAQLGRTALELPKTDPVVAEVVRSDQEA